jgi:tryptophan halogenase
MEPGDAGQAAMSFNTQQTRQYQRIRDFIILHYCLSERRDSSFWRHVTGMELPASLAYKLHAWRETGALHNFDDEAFDETSWLAIHAGMGHWPQRRSPWMDEVPAPVAARYLTERHAAIAQLAATMPTHDEFLRQRMASVRPAAAPTHHGD